MTLAERIAKLRETARMWNGSMPQDRPTDLAMYKALRDALAIIEELEANEEMLLAQGRLERSVANEQRAENGRLREFASYVLVDVFNGIDIDDVSTQDKAEALGLLELRPVDPKDSIEGEEEHYFLVWAPRSEEKTG